VLQRGIKGLVQANNVAADGRVVENKAMKFVFRHDGARMMELEYLKHDFIMARHMGNAVKLDDSIGTRLKAISY